MGTIGDIFHTLVKAYWPLTTNTLSLTVIAATEGCTHKSLSAKAKAIISEYSTGLLEGEMLAWQLSTLIEMFVATLSSIAPRALQHEKQYSQDYLDVEIPYVPVDLSTLSNEC